MPKKSVIDPTLPKVPLELAGKKHFLCFDFNAIATAEQLTGLNLIRALRSDEWSALQLRALLYSALLKLQPDVTLEDAGALINIKTMAKVTNAIVEAFTESHPEPEKGEKAEADPNVETPE
jgi:hypothetical protein